MKKDTFGNHSFTIMVIPHQAKQDIKQLWILSIWASFYISHFLFLVIWRPFWKSSTPCTLCGYLDLFIALMELPWPVHCTHGTTVTCSVHSWNYLDLLSALTELNLLSVLSSDQCLVKAFVVLNHSSAEDFILVSRLKQVGSARELITTCLSGLRNALVMRSVTCCIHTRGHSPIGFFFFF